jgi:tetratricopeptide (TPR) repeat protein
MKYFISYFFIFNFFFSKNLISLNLEKNKFINQYIKFLKNQDIKIEDQNIEDLFFDLIKKTAIEISLSRYQNAFEFITQALKINPSNSFIHLKISEILEKLPALSYSRRFVLNREDHILIALKLNPEKKNYKTAINFYKKKEQFQECIDLHLSMKKKYKSEIEDLFDLADIYFLNKEYQKSIKIYEEIENKLGFIYEIFEKKIRIYFLQKKESIAYIEWQNLIKKNYENRYYASLYVKFLIENFSEEKAILFLKEYLKNFPDFFEFYSQLIILIFKSNLKETKNYIMIVINNNKFSLNEKISILEDFINLQEKNIDKNFIENCKKILLKLYPNIKSKKIINEKINKI